ncbi:unnamed protein product, partial [Rangifer tarandus platyrhynchus]
SGGGVFAAVTSSPIHPAGPAEAPEPLADALLLRAKAGDREGRASSVRREGRPSVDGPAPLALGLILHSPRKSPGAQSPLHATRNKAKHAGMGLLARGRVPCFGLGPCGCAQDTRGAGERAGLAASFPGLRPPGGETRSGPSVGTGRCFPGGLVTGQERRPRTLAGGHRWLQGLCRELRRALGALCPRGGRTRQGLCRAGSCPPTSCPQLSGLLELEPAIPPGRPEEGAAACAAARAPAPDRTPRSWERRVGRGPAGAFGVPLAAPQQALLLNFSSLIEAPEACRAVRTGPRVAAVAPST